MRRKWLSSGVMANRWEKVKGLSHRRPEEARGSSCACSVGETPGRGLGGGSSLHEGRGQWLASPFRVRRPVGLPPGQWASWSRISAAHTGQRLSEGHVSPGQRLSLLTEPWSSLQLLPSHCNVGSLGREGCCLIHTQVSPRGVCLDGRDCARSSPSEAPAPSMARAPVRPSAPLSSGLT